MLGCVWLRKVELTGFKASSTFACRVSAVRLTLFWEFRLFFEVDGDKVRLL